MGGRTARKGSRRREGRAPRRAPGPRPDTDGICGGSAPKGQPGELPLTAPPQMAPQTAGTPPQAERSTPQGCGVHRQGRSQRPAERSCSHLKRPSACGRTATSPLLRAPPWVQTRGGLWDLQLSLKVALTWV